MPSRRLLLLVVALFALTVLVRLPAQWVVALLPEGIACVKAHGTLWNGGCATLRTPQLRLQLSPVSWQLQPAQLLRGRLAAGLHSADPRLRADLQLSLHLNGTVELRDVKAQLRLEQGLSTLLPDNWNGLIQLDLPAAQLRARKLQSLQGVIRAQQLHQLRPPIEFGSYELSFAGEPAPAGAITGRLRDLAGPLAVAGTLQLKPNYEYELNGTAAARADASADLQRVVEFLGPADESGNRPFSVAGAF